MEPFEIVILVIESIDFLASALFLAFFVNKLRKIKPMAVTNKYLDTNMKVRMMIYLIFIIIGTIKLTIEFIYIEVKNYKLIYIIESGTINFIMSMIVFYLHIKLFSIQLKRQKKPTNLHNAFVKYFSFICCGWFCDSVLFGVVKKGQQKGQQTGIILIIVLSSLQVLISFGMLIFWQYKQKRIPFLYDLSDMDSKVIKQKFTSFKNIQTQQFPSKKSKYEWNIIYPNVEFKMGKICITLSIISDQNLLRSELIDEQQFNRQFVNFRSVKDIQQPKLNLQVLTQKQYSKNEIQQIYLKCSCLNTISIIQFQNIPDAYYYQGVKTYIEQLFSLKQACTKQILQLFDLDQQQINQVCHRVKKMIKSDNQLLISSYVDNNSLFLSIEIFKHMWVRNHFIFYIQTIAVDCNQKAVCYKRYRDFEQFHDNLQKAVNLQRKDSFLLPKMPKKHYFSWGTLDQFQVKERRKQLEAYCRQTFNDYLIMTKIPCAKKLILQFLQLQNSYRLGQILPNQQKAIQFYQGLKIQKGNVYKALVKDQYVTFYQFVIIKNNQKIITINKRFNQFNQLHQSLNRWMTNAQIKYKQIVLPEKHLYNSVTKRHENLRGYLQTVVSIKQAYKLYAITDFLTKTPQNEVNRGGISIVRQPSYNEDSTNQVNMGKEQINLCELHSQDKTVKENVRGNIKGKDSFSVLIDQLGE